MDACVVRIDYGAFASRRPRTDIQTSVGNRIESLLNKYACFDAAPTPPSSSSCASRHTYVHHPRRPTSSWVRLPEVSTSAPRSKATVSGSSVIDTLNKVTDDNYPRMLERILSAMRSTVDSPMEICNAILRKCYEQDFFLHLYLRIMADVLAQGPYLSFRDQLAVFASNTISLDLLISLPRQLGRDTGYDGFCERVKSKKQLIGRARTTVGLIDMGLVPASHADFFDGAVTALISFCERPPARSVASTDTDEHARATEYDDDHADVAVEYLKEFMTKKDHRTTDRLGTLQGLLISHIVPACSLMCKFKMQGVIGATSAHQPLPPQPLPPHTPDPDREGGAWQSTTRPRQQARHPACTAREPVHSRIPGERRAQQRG